MGKDRTSDQDLTVGMGQAAPKAAAAQHVIAAFAADQAAGCGGLGGFVHWEAE